MADSKYSSGSRRNVTLKPNTKSSHYSTRTCKVRSCKSRTLNPDTGFCFKHTRNKLDNEEIYEKCRECSQMVTSDDYGVTCSKCDFWSHIKCVGISQDQYKCMIADCSRDTPLFHWYCRFCRDKCIEAVSKIDLLENQTRNLSSKLVKLDERVNSLESKLSGKVKETVRGQLEQRFDIDRRKFNVIIFNAPESEQSHETVWQTEQKKAADIRFFCKVANESLDMSIGDGSDYIKDAVRLGSSRNDGKPRLLRITFLNMAIKREVLGKAKLLKRSKYSSIYINPDLTPEQRKIDADLRKNLKERKENGESGLFIRRGKIEKLTEADKAAHDIIINDKENRESAKSDGDDFSIPDLDDRKTTSDSGSEDDDNLDLESISSATLTNESDSESDINDIGTEHSQEAEFANKDDNVIMIKETGDVNNLENNSDNLEANETASEIVDRTTDEVIEEVIPLASTTEDTVIEKDNIEETAIENEMNSPAVESQNSTIPLQTDGIITRSQGKGIGNGQTTQ